METTDKITKAVLLRTLTLKSTISFGKYYNSTIEFIINSVGNVGKEYLRWCYYNIEGISFNDEILDILKITNDLRINKPGCNKILWEEKIKNHCKYTTKQGWQFIKASRKLAKDRIRIQTSTNQNLAKLQRYNQGHR